LGGTGGGIPSDDVDVIEDDLALVVFGDLVFALVRGGVTLTACCVSWTVSSTSVTGVANVGSTYSVSVSVSVSFSVSTIG
jgi:hypothetical protein